MLCFTDLSEMQLISHRTTQILVPSFFYSFELKRDKKKTVFHVNGRQGANIPLSSYPRD